MKCEVAAFVAIRLAAGRRLLGAPSRRPRQAQFGRHIDDQREVGNRGHHDDPLESLDRRSVEASCVTLIDACRIRKAIADDPAP